MTKFITTLNMSINTMGRKSCLWLLKDFSKTTIRIYIYVPVRDIHIDDVLLQRAHSLCATNSLESVKSMIVAKLPTKCQRHDFDGNLFRKIFFCKWTSLGYETQYVGLVWCWKARFVHAFSWLNVSITVFICIKLMITEISLPMKNLNKVLRCLIMLVFWTSLSMHNSMNCKHV